MSSSRVPYDHAEYQNKFRLFSGQNQIKSKIYHQVMWYIWWNNSFLGIFLVLSRIILADSRGFLRFSKGSLSNDRKWKNSCIKMDSFKKNFKIFATYFTTGRIILTRKRSSHSCKHFSSSWLDSDWTAGNDLLF